MIGISGRGGDCEHDRVLPREPGAEGAVREAGGVGVIIVQSVDDEGV